VVSLDLLERLDHLDRLEIRDQLGQLDPRDCRVQLDLRDPLAVQVMLDSLDPLEIKVWLGHLVLRATPGQPAAKDQLAHRANRVLLATRVHPEALGQLGQADRRVPWARLDK
jgi:hypothetical protein